MGTKFETMETVEIDASLLGGDDYGYDAGTDDSSIETDRGDSYEQDNDSDYEGELETHIVDDGAETEAETEAETGAETEAETEAETGTEAGTETEAETTEQGTTKTERGKRNNMVPRDRLNKEIEARRVLEARIAALESGQAGGSEADSKNAPALTPDMVSRMFEAALDGKNDDAVAALSEILSVHEQSVLDKARGLTNQEVEGRLHRERINTELGQAAKEVAESYPEFDPDNECFDSGLVDEVIAIRDTLIHRGHAPAQALHRAARSVAQENNIEPIAKANPLAKPATKKVDVSKKVDVANKQPAKLAGAGGRSGAEKTLDVFKMNDKDFDSLSKDQLARLRGDYF